MFGKEGCKVQSNQEEKIQVSLLLCFHMQCNASVEPFLLDLSILFTVGVAIISSAINRLKTKIA